MYSCKPKFCYHLYREEGEVKIGERLGSETNQLMYQVGNKTDGVHIPQTPRIP